MAVAAMVESAVVFGFVGATVSMGAIVLVCFMAATGYGVSKVARRRQALRARTARLRPIAERDKKAIMGHIDELLGACRELHAENHPQPEAISEADKRMIMEHVDALLEMGHEHSGEVQS